MQISTKKVYIPPKVSILNTNFTENGWDSVATVMKYVIKTFQNQQNPIPMTHVFLANVLVAHVHLLLPKLQTKNGNRLEFWGNY